MTERVYSNGELTEVGPPFSGPAGQPGASEITIGRIFRCESTRGAWGGTYAESNVKRTFSQYAEEVVRFADDHRQSGTSWGIEAFPALYLH
jgi:hypothetical protein